MIKKLFPITLILALSGSISSAVTGTINATVDINRLIDQIQVLATPDLTEARPWSSAQMTSYLMNFNDKVYVDCVKSGHKNKGCPAEYPWNRDGCFLWATGGGLYWRRCDKVKSGRAFWDAGSQLKKIFESEPINSRQEIYDELMKNPRRFEIINKVRY